MAMNSVVSASRSKISYVRAVQGAKQAFYFCLYIIALVFFYRILLHPMYAYAGFGYISPSLESLLAFMANCVFFILICVTISDGFLRFTAGFWLLLAVFPASTFALFNGIPYGAVYIYYPLFTLLWIADKVRATPLYNPPNSSRITEGKSFRVILVILISLLLIPFLLRIRTINWRNLLFEDIYETRAESAALGSIYITYMKSNLSRVIIPFAMIYSLQRKIKWLTVFCVFSTLLVFLTGGAGKEVVFSLALYVSIYYVSLYRNYSDTLLQITLLVIALLCVCLLVDGTLDTNIFTTYIRRGLFVHANLDNTYMETFANNYTYFQHTRTVSFITNSVRSSPIRYVAENVFGRSFSPNVGMMIEGYISLGYLGVWIISGLVLAITIMIRNRKIDKAYIGMWAVMINVMSGAFFETSLLTHGLFLFLLLAFSGFISPTRSIAKQ